MSGEAWSGHTHHHDRGLHFACRWLFALVLVVVGGLLEGVGMGNRPRRGRGARGCEKDRWYGLEVLLWCRRPGSSLLKVGCPEKFRKSDPPELPAGA
jgi:hypothetical protein